MSLSTTTTGFRATDGFTLVELAIVLIIISLILGGVLKGQELIGSSRVIDTISQLRGLQVATGAFSDTFAGYPGDFVGAAKKVPGCTESPCVVADTPTLGNGVIDDTAGDPLVLGHENLAFFSQLMRAGLIDGLDGQDVLAVGSSILPTKLDNGAYFRVGYVDRPAMVPGTRLGGGANLRPGHWLAILGKGLSPDQDFGGPNVTYDQAVGVLEDHGFTPKLAQRVDTKFDDANPNNGVVVAINVGADAAANKRCAANGVAADYNTANSDGDCSLYVRFSE